MSEQYSQKELSELCNKYPYGKTCTTAANDLERYLLRKEAPSTGAIARAIYELRELAEQRNEAEEIFEEKKPQFVPFDLHDRAVRLSLMFKVVTWKGIGNSFYCIIGVSPEKVILSRFNLEESCGEIYTPEELLEDFTFDDGTPCGRRVEA